MTGWRDPVSSSPLVTMIVLGYRQEGLVQQAITAAFAQDYPNLEIVLSHDCSPDRTGAVMASAAAAYRGPHRVRCNVTPENLGTLGHIYHAVGSASGELIVIAAGDDLSYPHRVSTLVEHWRRTGAAALFSDWDVVDENGVLVRRGRPEADALLDLSIFFPGRQVLQIGGATAAYDRRVFSLVPQPAKRLLAEDLFFSLVLAWLGQPVVFVPEALVAYRAHSQSLTHAGSADVHASEQATQKAASMGADVLEAFHRMVADAASSDRVGGGSVPVDMGRLRAQAVLDRFVARWLEATILERFGALARVRSRLGFRWMLPRLFGLRGLLAIKAVRDRLR